MFIIIENIIFASFRSLSGEGNFNWRFVFPFNYMRHEDRVVYSQKKAFDIDPVEVKMPADLTLQVWDNELVRNDKFLGNPSQIWMLEYTAIFQYI